MGRRKQAGPLTTATDRRTMMSRHLVASALLAWTAGAPSCALRAQTRVDQEPTIALQGPDHFSFRVGRVEVTALSDGSNEENLHSVLRGVSATRIDALLSRAFMTNPVESNVNAFFFRLGNRAVLVDAGIGQFRPSEGLLRQSLASIHVDPAEITDILITHAHFDHLGGLLHDGKPSFPNATIHLSRIERDFFDNPANQAKNDYPGSIFGAASKVLRKEAAVGKVRTFESGEEVVPGVIATVHPGHTPGSAFYQLRSGTARLVFTGDIFHVIAVQLPEPQTTIIFDVDQALAARTRKTALRAFAAERTLLAVPHGYFPGVGHIRANGKGYEWAPMQYSNRTPDGTIGKTTPETPSRKAQSWPGRSR